MLQLLQRNESVIHKVVMWLLLLSLITPLIYGGEHFVYPFITTKVFYFGTIIQLALGGYLLLLIVNFSKYRPPRSALIGVVSLFLLWIFISTILGVDFFNSFWGNYERMMGVFWVAHYVLFFVILASVLKEEKEWHRLLFFASAIGVLVLVAAVIQHFKPDFLFGGHRAASTLGNPIYLSLYSVYIGFLSVYLFLRYRSEKYVKYGLLLVVGLSVLAFVFAESRGAVVGLGAAIVWMCVWNVVLSRQKIHRWVSLVVLLFILAVAVLIVTDYGSERFADLPIMRRLSTISLSGANESRLRAWSIGLDAWESRPIVGWGWFNFKMAYDIFYRPEQLKHGLGETWVDDAHNVIVNTMATTGTVGLILYLALWFTVFYLLWRVYCKKEGRLYEWILFSGLLIFHFIQNLFAFENPTSYLMLFLVFAFIVWRAQGIYFRKQIKERPELISLLPYKYVRAGVLITVILTIALIYYTNFVPVRAVMAHMDGTASLNKGDLSQWFGLYGKALELPTPYKFDIRGDMARELIKVPVDDSLRAAGMDALYDYVNGELRKNITKHPKYLTSYLVYADMLLAQHERFPDKYPEAAAEANEILQQARRFSPNRQQVSLLEAQTLVYTDQFQDAKDILYKARSLSPAIAQMHYLMAPFFEFSGLYEEAIVSYETAIKLAGDPQLVFGHPSQWEDFALLHIEHGNPMRGVWFLDQIMACRFDDIKWGTCPTDMRPSAAGLVPSREVFTGLVMYYQKAGNQERSELYKSIASEFYANFEVEE